MERPIFEGIDLSTNEKLIVLEISIRKILMKDLNEIINQIIHIQSDGVTEYFTGEDFELINKIRNTFEDKINSLKENLNPEALDLLVNLEYDS